MNFVKKRAVSNSSAAIVLLFIVATLFTGCGGSNVQLPTADQLYEFGSAGPLRSKTDVSKLVKARIMPGAYRVVPGDVLELQIPSILQAVTPELAASAESFRPYLCRVYDDSNITLPLIGQVEAAGKTLAEIEMTVVNEYYPRYCVERPTIVARVAEYKTSKVSVIGAVVKPGVYELRNDQMTLVTLLAEAGGIIETGAAVIRINRQDHSDLAKDEQAKDGHEPVQREQQATHTEYDPTEPNLCLTFEQFDRRSTRGKLKICKDNSLLCSQVLDIANTAERTEAVNKLTHENPGISSAGIVHRLSELAETIKPRSGKRGEPKSQKVNARLNRILKELSDGSAAHTAAAANVERRGETSIAANTDSVLGLLPSADAAGAKGPADISDTTGKDEPIVLPVEGMDIPFADVAINDGDSVMVERLEIVSVTVLGLVNRPGTFPYPTNMRYNLAQVVGLAGGLNQVAEPRYTTVYRQKADGTIVGATFNVANGSGFTDAANIVIKPGDIIVAEQTPRTRRKLLLDKLFRVNLGVYTSIPLPIFGSRY